MAIDKKFHAGLSLKPIVSIVGLGFVGSAMAAALSSATDVTKQPLYRVLGIDLPTKDGLAKINCVNNGTPPVLSNDPDMDKAYAQAKILGNLYASSNIEDIGQSDIIVIDIPFDVKKELNNYAPRLDLFLDSVRSVAKYIKPEALVIIETTVPPGTTENYIYPIFIEEFKKRNLSIDSLSLSHSYERVTPGKNYLHSITNFYRVYAGIGEAASIKTKSFLESFINTKDYPLTRLNSPTESEMAKVMENSFRAVNIAFLQEWTELAEGMGVNMFDILSAIRMRPTHKNIMSPGFGVGGYCLTKDALLADWASQKAVNKKLTLSCESLQINDSMSGYSVDRLEKYFGSLVGKKIMLMGVSYLNDVSDTRYSPSEYFVNLCVQKGADIGLHDPIVTYWAEKDISIENLNDNKFSKICDAVVLAVKHSDYMDITALQWIDLFPNAKLFLDSNNIISETVAKEIRDHGRDVLGIGKGHWKVREM